MAISLQCIIRFTLRLYTDHTLPSDAIKTADACDKRSDTYFAKEGNLPAYGMKRKNETADLEKWMIKYNTRSRRAV